MAKTKTRKPKSNTLLRESKLMATVQYGPEKSALNALLRQARDDLASGIIAEEGAARGIQAAIVAARPQMVKAYAGAEGTRSAASKALRKDLSLLGAAANPYKAASATEEAGARRRLKEGLTYALTDLSQRKVAAAEGRAFNISNLQGKAARDVEQVNQRKLSLSREEGAFVTSTYGKLREARSDRKIKLTAEKIKSSDKRATLDETKRHNRSTEDIARTKANKKPGKKGPSDGQKTEHRKLVRQLENAISTYRRMPKGSKRGDIIRLMTMEKSQDNPYGGYDDVITTAAADLVRSGYIGPYNARRLKNVGLLKVPARYRRKKGYGGQARSTH